MLLVIFFAWAGRGGASKAFKLPSSSTLLAVLAVVGAVIGIVIATRQGRSFAARKVLPPLRSSLASLGRVARSPVRLTLLFGGSALVTLAYVGGLVASVEAFGGGASIAKIGAVYMAASVVAAATPTPGGVGGFEAAAIAGLTGIGISSGAAVSAVVIYRLATYWLPVLPGWLSWRRTAAPGLRVTAEQRSPDVLAAGRDGTVPDRGIRRSRRMPVARNHCPFGLQVL